MCIPKTWYLPFLLLVLLIFTSPVHAKDYSIPQLQIEVQINEDGSLRIMEHRTYVFDGEFSWANYKLPKNGFSAISNIQVSEVGKNFTNLNTEEPHTFLVEESKDAFNIKWFYNAENERRVFTISYTLDGAIVTGPEWSEFFWNYAAAGREKSTDQITILVQLPQTLPNSSLHSWVREPAWEIESNYLDNGFQFTGSDISRAQAVIIRTVFPTSVFDENSINITNPDFSLAWAQNQEANYRKQKQEQAAEQERKLMFGIDAVVILMGLSILAYVFFYRKYGARHKINLSQNESLMIPGRQKPASIGWLLMHRIVSGNHVTATLLDLARQGYLTIKEEEPEQEKWYSTKKSGFEVHPTEKVPETNMTEWEKRLLDFVTSRVTKEGHVIEDIFKFSDSEVSKWFSEWKKSVEEYCMSKGWIDKSSYKGVFWNLGIQIFLFLVATACLFMIHPILAIAMGVTFFASVFSLAIIRRTPTGEELYQSWKNYHNALKNAEDYSIPENHLGQHFIYGIAFGLGKQNIEKMFEHNPNAISTIYWISILPDSSSSPADMASSFSNLAATGTISAGGGATGSGASSGSAGGGASGGAG